MMSSSSPFLVRVNVEEAVFYQNSARIEDGRDSLGRQGWISAF